MLLIQQNIAQSFQSPLVRVVLGAIGLALLYVFYKEVRKIPAKLFTLMITAFVDMVGLLMIIPLLPFYVKTLGGTGINVLGMHLGVGSISGIIIAAFTVAQLASAPMWGRFSDRVGRRPTLLIAICAAGIAYLIFGLATSLCVLSMIFVARFLRESRDCSDQPQVGEVRRSSSQAVWHVISHASEPSSRLIWIYAIAIGAFQGSFAVLALFLNARFQVTEQTIFYFFMYTGAISMFTRVLLLGRMVDWLGEAKLSRLGLVLLAGGVSGMPLSRNLGTLAFAVALIPLGTAFTFPCVTALLSRVVSQRERGLYMGMQQTYGGVARIIAPLFYGWAFDSLGVSSPYFFSSAFILATIFLGFGLDEYARHEPLVPLEASSNQESEVLQEVQGPTSKVQSLSR